MNTPKILAKKKLNVKSANLFLQREASWWHLEESLLELAIVFHLYTCFPGFIIKAIFSMVLLKLRPPLSSRSGWINNELFIEVLKHIQKHTNSIKERPILLICDNLESHISVEAINYSRENGIVYLSFPLHPSRKPTSQCRCFRSF